MKKSLLFVLMSLSLSAQAGSLLPPGSADQSPSRLQAAPVPAGVFERQPLAFAWALDPSAELAAPAPYLAESREFWTVVEGAELKRGLAIDTSAPGAVIRVSPVGAVGAVQADALRVSKGGKRIPEPQSFQRKASAEQLQAAGMDLPAGSAVVQIADRHGQGRFELQLPQAAGRYLVHVYEPNSPFVLKAQAARGRVLAGDTIEVAAVLQRGQAKLGGGQVGGELVSPSGRSWPLAFVDGKARVDVPVDAAATPGLWEVQLSAGTAVDGGSVQRDARTAFEVTQPTARLAGGYAFDAGKVAISLPLEIAAAGRYEVRGTLFATGADGVGRPVAQAHAANWFEPGKRQLALAFGAVNVPLGYGAPYELRFLELKDQTRMGTLDTRELALREGAAPERPGAPGRGRLR